jgi:NAD(P)-dependent dehydrogenase (short-subunit alcohol dehydrogenase family)
MKQLQNKVTLITGGGTGIGKACALTFAGEGSAIAICGRRADVLEKTCREIEATGVRASFTQGDIGNPDDVERIVATAVRELGGIDCLINNASVVGQVGPVEELDLNEWDAALRINLTGTLLCCQKCIPVMRQRGGGTIINVSSNVGRRGFPNRAPYVCSKWAMHGLGQTLAHEVAKDNIRVNTICPGPVMTDRLKRSMAQMAGQRGITVEEIHEEWTAQSPMKRFATEEECASVALFLATDASSAMTGQAINVTAGMMMT